jgi:hypothetical protein
MATIDATSDQLRGRSATAPPQPVNLFQIDLALRLGTAKTPLRS